MRKTLFVSIVFTVFSAYSQNKIEGKILDEKDQGVSYCALALLNANDSSLVKGNVTNENGEYFFESFPAGSYLIKATYVGYDVGYSPLFTIDSANQLKFDPLHLKASAVNLNEVSVSVFKPTVEFKKGIVVLNVENNLLASGNTVLELLKRVPGVIVDAQNNITINGKSGVRFLIDGRLQQIPAAQMINMLSSMSADVVSTIELIKNPPAKYDAAGTAGLINIVTKKAKIKGFNGSVSEIMGQGKRYRTTSTTSLNYKSNKLSVFSNFAYMNLHFVDVNKLDRVLNNSATTDLINSIGKTENFRDIFNFNAGLEYELTKKTIVGFNVSGGPSFNNPVSTSRTNIDGGNSFDYNYLTYRTTTSQRFRSPSYNINAIHKFDSTTQLQFSADYTDYIERYYRSNENKFYNNNDEEVAPANNYQTQINRDFKIFTQKLDFTKEFKKSLTLETGFKSSFVRNKSNLDLDMTDPYTGSLYRDTLFSNKYDYKEQIIAGYANLIKTYKKITTQTGLRAEQTIVNAVNTTNGYNLTRNYLNFFPNASVDYTINNKNSLQLSYSYRIDRPGYDQLNPIRVYNEQLNLGTGNPQLRPQYSHNFNLDYSFNNFITQSVNYAQMSNMIYYYSYTPDSSKINIDTVFNMPNRKNFSYSIFAQKQIKWYNFQLFGIYTYRSLSGTIFNEKIQSETNSFSFSLNNEFNLPKNFKLQLFGYYNTPFRDGIQLYSPSGSLNMVVQKTFYNNKLLVALGFYDMFYTEVGAHKSTLSNQSYYYKEKNDTRRGRFTITYKFGKLKFEQKSKHSNDDENNRIKKPG